MERQEHRRGHGHAGELGGADASDDRGVGEHVERFRDQCPERRDRQPHDLPVVLAAPHKGRPDRSLRGALGVEAHAP
jgi:hypothetical protein